MSQLQVLLQHQLGAFRLDVDFIAPATGVTALFGPSGSGKTSILRAIAGLLRTHRGTVVINDEVWQSATRFMPVHMRPLGYVFQEASLFAHLSVRKNLEYGWRRLPASERKIDFDDVVGLLGIEPLLQRSTHALSGGERQRIALGRALLTSPRLLLMDEPLSALDHAAKQTILPYLESLHNAFGIPALYVSHDPAEVARLANHMLLVDNGRVTAQGTAADLLTRLDLPVAGHNEAVAILEGRVVEQDHDFHLTWIALPGVRIAVPKQELSVGQHTRVEIAARDVSLALSRHADTSILNILPATVLDLQDASTSQLLVRLQLRDGQTLLSRITRRSAKALELHTGRSLFAQVKSVALIN